MQKSATRLRHGITPSHQLSRPASPLAELRGYSKCGYALVLKGLVFPQWKKRSLAVMGSRLFLYPACSDSRPEWMELAGGGAVCYAPSRLGKLVLRVTGLPARINSQQHQRTNNSGKSSGEENHKGTVVETRHLYLGFHHPWDRDLWRRWLKQACKTSEGASERLDMSKSGLSRIPDSIGKTFTGIKQFFLGHNQLAQLDGNLKVLQSFPELQELHLERNRLRELPKDILRLKNLTFLDLSNNKISQIPDEISELVNLRELILDRNDIKELPDKIKDLEQLQHISVAENLIEIVPAFLLEMRAFALADVLTSWGESSSTRATSSDDKAKSANSLHKVNLRNNQLKGNIILGNYGNLTHLDLSENSIEKLDLSALEELRSVRCARNLLTELTLCGRNLVSLIAGNNRLIKLTVVPVPVNLEHLDVSFNELDCLPEWCSELPLLRSLFASNNYLRNLPDKLFSSPSRLEVLDLPHNQIQAFPPVRKSLNIVHLTLQDNQLTTLPSNFFANMDKLKILNLSNNNLSELPYRTEDKPRNNSATNSRKNSLEKLFLTGNCLTNSALDALGKFNSLRLLHMAYNNLDTLSESCVASWKEMEELILSGNRLQYLPNNIANLPHLRVLRVHSNRLLSCPAFNKTPSLKVLDLAHNQLDRINVESLVSQHLQFLDISCNNRLQVDPRQFELYSTKRPVSLVDVSGQNRTNQLDNTNVSRSTEHLPWKLGFSETAGTCEKLFVSQVRLPSFCSSEALVGLVDGSSNQEAPVSIQETIGRLLLQEKTIKETAKDYLRYTLLSTQKELGEKGHKYGVEACLVHVRKGQDGKYLLTAATCGEAKAILCRASGPLQLAKGKGKTPEFAMAMSEPTSQEVQLQSDDEFVVMANRRMWEVLSVEEAVREARAEANPVLAAKRLQDLGQAYGAEDNLSIIVLRLSTVEESIREEDEEEEEEEEEEADEEEDMDPISRLMRELRDAVRLKGKSNGNGSPTVTCTCPCCLAKITGQDSPAACCCHATNSNDIYLNGVLKNVLSGRSSTTSRSRDKDRDRDERSSPSGQSDQTSEGKFDRKSRKRGSARGRFSKGSNSRLGRNTTASSSCSDEQLRCWEYMLEQNTQLLFDKELDTLTAATSPARSSPLNRGHSKSTPHLASGIPFLSRHFGSARSFDNAGASSKTSPMPLAMPSFRPIGSVQAMPMFRSFGGSRRILNGGPNAAYFSSLQRLMPYNLEYDFAVIQEKNTLDSLEQDASRMQQYWGVATTEL